MHNNNNQRLKQIRPLFISEFVQIYHVEIEQIMCTVCLHFQETYWKYNNTNLQIMFWSQELVIVGYPGADPGKGRSGPAVA